VSDTDIAICLVGICIISITWGFWQYWKRIQAEESVLMLSQYIKDKKLNFTNYTIYRHSQEPEVHDETDTRNNHSLL
jgi:hypothetical protein